MSDINTLAVASHAAMFQQVAKLEIENAQLRAELADCEAENNYLRADLAETEAKLAALHEPVAWIVEHDDYPTEVELISEIDHAPEARKKDEAMGWRFTPLYAAPQPAIPEGCGITNPSGHTALYFDLLMRVQNKIPGETRHETANRIIEQHENGGCQPMLAAQQENSNGN